MRWPGSGRPGRRGDKAVGSGADGSGAPGAPDPSARERAAEPPAWRTLPPVTSAWSGSAPLLNPGSAAPLVTAPLVPGSGTAAQPAGGPGAPEPGRVVGLAAHVRPPRPAVHEPVQPPQYLQSMPPLRHAPTRPLVERPPLTAATDEFVGEPLAPPTPEPPPAPAPAPAAAAPPFRPHQFTERPDPPVEASTEAGARFREALANLHKSGLPRYEPGAPSPEPVTPPAAAPPATSAAPSPPPATTDAVAPGGTFRPPSLTHRRSLAESRRLGLGAPMREVPTPEQVLEPAPRPDSLADALEATAAAAAAPPVSDAPPPAPPLTSPAAPVPGPAAATPSPTAAEPAPQGDEPPDEPPPPSGGLRPTPVVRPITDPTVRPTASAAPLVFRATTSRPLPPADPAPGVPRAVVTRPPAELAQALRSSHGIDVADVPVRQDAESTREATRRRARGFTRGATVHLPEHVDVETSGPGRAVLAHELVHAAQQRRLAGALPAEGSPEGQALEAEALAAERAHGGSPREWTSDEPLRHSAHRGASTSSDGTQHAFWDDEPNEAWGGLTLFSEDQVHEIKYHVARMLTERGGSGGAGGGAGGFGADLSQTAVGTWKARDKEEWRAQILSAYNLELQMQGMPTVTWDTMPKEQQDTIDKQFDAAEEERRVLQERQKALKEKAEANEKELKDKKDRLAQTEKKSEAATMIPTVDGGFVEKANWNGSSVDKDEQDEKDAGVPKAGPGAALLATSAAVKGGAGKAPKADDVKLTEVEKLALDPDPEVTAYKVRTREEFYAQVLGAYNLERQMQGMEPVSKLEPDEENLVYQQFDEARTAAIKARYDKAKAADDRRAAEEQLLKDKRAAIAGQRSSEATAAAPALTESASTPTTTTSAEPATPAAVATSTPEPSTADDNITYEKLEQFAERIYDRVRTRLRAELLIDRERSGMPINR